MAHFPETAKRAAAMTTKGNARMAQMPISCHDADTKRSIAAGRGATQQATAVSPHSIVFKEN